MGSNQSSLALKLDLSGKGIKDLDKDVKQPHILPTMPKLQEINLSKNKLAVIPDVIVKDMEKSPKVLEFLQVLNLSRNKFTEIPDAVWLLINLKSLNLDYNEISHISDKLLTFYRLETFSVIHNKLKRIPWGIHRLHALKELAIEENEITWLPNPLSKMYNLKQFMYIPNPLDGSYDKFVETDDLIKYLRTQKVPPDYREEARKERENDDQKREKLSADGRIVRALLSYQEGLAAIETHMKKEFSHENLAFYRDVRDFRRKYNSPVEIRTGELIADAKKLFEDYVADSAPHQINLPAEVIAALKKMFTDTFNFPRGINQWIFDEAYRASFDLMVRDTFSRFRVTQTGKDLIEQLKKIEGARLNLPHDGSKAALKS